MTVDELREAHARLESQLQDLIADFEQRTSFSCERVELLKQPQLGALPVDRTRAVYVTVGLGYDR